MASRPSWLATWSYSVRACAGCRVSSSSTSATQGDAVSSMPVLRTAPVLLLRTLELLGCATIRILPGIRVC